MDLATVGLRVDERGAVVALDRFTGAAHRATGAGTGVERMAAGLRRGLAALGLAFGVSQMVEYADSWRLIEGRISLTTTSTRVAAAVQDELFAAAQRSRSQLEGVANLYSRVAQNAEQLGVSQRRVIDFTETVGKSFIVSSAGVGQMGAAITQLGQALGSGRLQGDELRSILENAPRLARAIAEGMGVTIGELRRMGAEGRLTSQEVFEAIESQRSKIEEEFRKMPVTIGQSFTVLNNEVRRYVGEGDAALGASALIGSAIILLSQNIDLLAKGLGGALLVWGSYIAVTKAASLASAAAATVKGILAAAAVAEAAAARGATASIVGYETAAVSAGVASGAAAAGMTTAAGAATLLTAAGRGLVAVLTGPIGIALALAAVIAGLISYKARSLEAARATDEFANSLIGLSKAELGTLAIEVEQNILRLQFAMEALKVAGERQNANRHPVAEALGLFGIDVGASPLEDLEGQMRVLQQQRGMLASQQEIVAELEKDFGGTTRASVDLTKAERQRLRTIMDLRAGMDEMLRAASQELAAAQLQGTAQREQATRYQVANDLLRLNAELREKVAAGTIRQADADLLASEGARKHAEALDIRLKALNATAVLEARQGASDRMRGMEQELDLATRYGLAQDQLRIRFEAANRAIEARRELTGEALEETLAAIRAEEAIAQQLLIVQRFGNDMAGVLNDTFYRIFSGGIRTFGDLFDGIKEMFFRTLAEMATDQVMRGLGAKLLGVISRVLGTGNAAGVAEAAATAAATGQGAVQNSRENAIALEPLVVTAQQRRSLVQQIQGALQAAFAGLAIGQLFGGSGSTLLGGLGGAAGGAASGFAMGGPAGAIVGGLAGLGAGILGAHRRQEQLEAQRMAVINANSATIRELTQSIDGSPLLSGRNLAGGSGLAGMLGGLTSLSRMLDAVVGRFIPESMVRRRDLEDALRGGESSDALRLIETQFGITVQEVGRMARQLGIELFDAAGRLVPDALTQLAEALQLTIRAATQFGNNLDDIRLRQEARRRLFDEGGGQGTPGGNLADAYEVLSRMAPELLRSLGLANLNLDTEAGRNVLLEGLRDIFRLIESGNLTPALLGAFTDKGQLLDAILGAKDALDAFRGAMSEVTTDFPKVMSLALWEHEIGTGVRRPPGSRFAPPGPNDAGPGGGIIFTGPVNLNLSTTPDEPDEAFRRRIERALLNHADRGGVTILHGSVTTHSPG